MGDAGLVALCDGVDGGPGGLGANVSLTDLDLAFKGLGSSSSSSSSGDDQAQEQGLQAGVAALAKALTTRAAARTAAATVGATDASSLLKLALDRNEDLGDEGVAVLCSAGAPTGLAGVGSLGLSECGLGSAGVKALARDILRHPASTLRTLDLARNPALGGGGGGGRRGEESTESGEAGDSRSSCETDAEGGIAQLGLAVHHSTTLAELNLDGCDLSATAVTFAAALFGIDGGPTAAARVSSSADSAAPPAAAFQQPKALVRLSLCGNGLGAREMGVIAAGLRGPVPAAVVAAGAAAATAAAPRLRVLMLNDNALGDEGAICLARGILASAGLETVEVAGNAISSDGGMALVATCGTSGVKHLRLFNNNFGSDGCLELADLCAGLPYVLPAAAPATTTAPTSTVLSAACAALGDGDASGSGATGHPGQYSLESLDLGGNDISADALGILCDALVPDDAASAAAAESVSPSSAAAPFPCLTSLGWGGNGIDGDAEEAVIRLCGVRPGLDIARDKHRDAADGAQEEPDSGDDDTTDAIARHMMGGAAGAAASAASGSLAGERQQPQQRQQQQQQQEEEEEEEEEKGGRSSGPPQDEGKARA